MESSKIESNLLALRKKYLKSKHPLFVWKAYKICRDATCSIPSWVLEYIDTVASKEMPDLRLEMELDAIHNFYKEKHNPLFLWEALKLCSCNYRPLPYWATNYFRDAAAKLLALAARQEKAGERAAFEVYRALGMKKPGSGNIFTQYQRRQREQKVIWKILDKAEFNEKGEIENIVKLLKEVTEELKKEDSMLEFGTVSDIYFNARGKLGLLPENHELILNEKRKKVAKNKTVRKKKALDKQKLQN
jgi:hypothetical protein